MAKRYHKTIVAAILLALYAFMVTPVSYWHQHSFDCNTAATKNASKQTVNISDADANCKICTHHYSVADNDAVIISFPALKVFSTYSDYYFLEKIANPGFSQSNKGPPARA